MIDVNKEEYKEIHAKIYTDFLGDAVILRKAHTLDTRAMRANGLDMPILGSGPPNELFEFRLITPRDFEEERTAGDGGVRSLV